MMSRQSGSVDASWWARRVSVVKLVVTPPPSLHELNESKKRETEVRAHRRSWRCFSPALWGATRRAAGI